jgi:hypothetical protein
MSTLTESKTAEREATEKSQVRPGSTNVTDELADRYRVMIHPEDYCYPAWCLAQVEIDKNTGRPWHNTDTHRRAVRSLEIHYGVLIQVGIGVSDDFELDLDHPFVHVWQADLDDNPECVEQLQLTAD